MITSAIKKQTSVCCSISLYPYYGISNLESRIKKETSDIVEGQRNYKSKIKKKIRKKCPSMASYFALSSYPELMVYTQTYMSTTIK